MPTLQAPQEQLDLAAQGKFVGLDGEVVDGLEPGQLVLTDPPQPTIANLDWVTLDRPEITALALGGLGSRVTDSTVTASRTMALRSGPPESVLWDEFQTDVRNQGRRFTCSGFCMVAAIEARYRRDFGLVLDLSEQFFWHLYKSTTFAYPPVFDYENQSSFWGGGGSHGLRDAVNFVVCEESHAPYLDRREMERLRDRIPGTGALEWQGDPAENRCTQSELDAFEYSTAYISDQARRSARYGVTAYELLDRDQAQDTGRLETILADGYEVLLDLDLKWTNADGVMRFDESARGGGHCFLLVGYDRSEEFFWVKNSWGGSAYTKVGYDLVRRTAYSAAYVTAVRDPRRPIHGGRFVGRWQMDHDGWEGELILRRWPEQDGSVRRLGHYLTGGRSRAVNGRWRDLQTIEFSVEDSESADPSQMRGQRHQVSIFSRDVSTAAGTTTWNNLPFGTQILRTPRHAGVPADRTFEPEDWIGTWAMDHDGWRGRLTIRYVGPSMAGVRAVKAAYVDSRGRLRTAKGVLSGSVGHALRLEITFSSHVQRFQIYAHTWDAVRFSGRTEWGGRTFGVVGTRMT